MALNPALARLAARMGLPPPPIAASPSDLLAFENHLSDLARSEVSSLDPARMGSLLPSVPSAAAAWRQSEALAVSVAHAYGVEISFVHGLPAWLGTQGTLGIYQEALPGHHQKAYGIVPEQHFPGRKEQILVEATLGPEARASVAWHEVGHLAFGHTSDAIPQADLTIGNLGARSHEYIANAFAAIMLEQTVPLPHPYHDAQSRSYLDRFDSAIDVIHDPSYTPETWDRQAGVARATEFFRANQDMILAKVAQVKQVAQGVRLPRHSVDIAVIPPDQQVSPEDISDLYSRAAGLPSVFSAPPPPDFPSMPDFSAPLTLPSL